MIRASIALGCLLMCGCATLKPNIGFSYDIFSKQAKFEFNLAPGSKGKGVVPVEKE
jgi:hypothetical protein